jgi:hypothetical protein
MRLSDLVAQHRQALSTYHDHKKKTAYAVATLYITGMSVWLLNDSWWERVERASRWNVAVAAIMTIIAMALAFDFVRWQFLNRLYSALLEAPCLNVAAKIVAGEIPDDASPHREWVPSILLPATLREEIDVVLRYQERQVKPSEYLTYAAITLWFAVVMGRLFLAMC